MTKALAKVLYLELRKSHNTAQILVVPPIKVEATASPDSMRVLSRQISSTHPRRSWRFYKSPVSTEVYATEDLSTAVHQTIPFIQDIEHYFRGFKSAGWDVYKTPLSVEITYDDIKEVREGNTPQALMRRLNRARIGAGYSEELFETN
jgi:hypothetical protein